VSRADRRVPEIPRLGRVLRDAGVDFYYNSLRMCGANLMVGALILAIGYLALVTPVALVLTPLLVLPMAGTMRMATRLARDGHTDLGDFWEVVRRPWPLLALGLAQLGVTVVLVGDVAIAAGWRSWAGTFLAASAAYGIAVLWAFAVVAWPIILDPERDGEPVRRRLRLAAAALVVHPIRVGLFAAAIGALMLVAVLLVAPVLTCGIAFGWLAIVRFVLPIADRVEGRVPRETVTEGS